MNNKKTAFSLVELSVTLIIISILITIVISSAAILQTARLSAARNITNSSIARDIDGMSLWLESTSIESFDDKDIQDGDLVENWNDIKESYQAKYIATQSTMDHRPLYDEDAINKLPGIVFDGNSDFLQISNFTANAYTTIFIVANVYVNGADFIMEHSANATLNNGFRIYTGGSNSIMYINRSSGVSASVSYSPTPFNSSQPTMLILRYDGTNNSFRINNNSFIDQADPDADNSIANDNLFIASRSGSYGFIDGAIGEIIVYDKALSNDEVDDVATYLNNKWSIY